MAVRVGGAVSRSHGPYGKAFWIGAVAGWAVIAFGVFGLLRDAARTRPENFALWFLGSALAHDALIAPLVFLVALGLVKVVPARIRPVIQAGLIVAGSVTVVSLPFVLGRGGATGNPSALPRNYTAGLLIILGVIAVITALAARHRTRQLQPSRDPGSQ